MTIDEAIKICNTMIFAASLSNPQGTPLSMTKEELTEAMGIAIKALEEVQQYRQIGTVEECREAVEKSRQQRNRITRETDTQTDSLYMIHGFALAALSITRLIAIDMIIAQIVDRKLDWSDGDDGN